MASRKPRTLVLCFDGTSNEYSDTNTNVIKFYALLKKDDLEDQMCYYQAGIGTYFQPGMVRPLLAGAARVLDQAFAIYLSTHVLDGYRFLMQNYGAGDRVCLLGFSRGAYTARALAGMLKKVGLLSKDNAEQAPFAYRIYASARPAEAALAPGCKQTFSRDVPVAFLGVWDTVASVGLVRAQTLPLVSMNSNVRTFRHALALDEHRVRFIPSLWNTAPPGADGGADAAPATEAEAFVTDVRAVWFAGCHSDVGGGSADDAAPHSLANIPLRWMVREALAAKSGIIFDADALARIGLAGRAPPTEPTNGLNANGNGAAAGEGDDALEPTHCQLRENLLWWAMELLPTSYYTLPKALGDKVVSQWGIHLGRGRRVPPGPNFHVSVRTRMEDAKLGYVPKARWDRGTETYVS